MEILDLIAVIIVWIVLSYLSGLVAKKKGRSFFYYFLFSILVGPVLGLVVSLLRKNIIVTESNLAHEA